MRKTVFNNLEVEIRDHLGWIRMNRPPLNCLTVDFMDDLIRAHELMDASPEVWAVLLTSSSEKFFSNGLDPDYILERTPGERAKVFKKLLKMTRVMYEFSKPQIAVINGHAFAGGAVLSVMADFRFMAAGKGKISFSETRVGLTLPDLLLPIIEAVVGPENMVRVAMMGEAFSPEQSLAMGLVDRVVEPDQLQAEAENYMREILDTMPLASMRSVKAGIRKRRVKMLRKMKRSGLRQMRAFLTGNFEEGLTAVRERRKPVFSNP